jgi:hypothetical protein
VEKISVDVLRSIPFRIATIEKHEIWPQAQAGAVRQNVGSFKTVLEPKTGPFEPFGIAHLKQYLHLFQ